MLRKLALLTFALALSTGIALAQDDGDEEEPKKKTRAERIAEAKKRKAEARERQKEKRAKQNEANQQKAEERFKKMDSRTVWEVNLKLKSKKKVDQIADGLKKLSPIDEAELNKDKGVVELKLAGSAKLLLIKDLRTQLRKTGADVDERKLKLPKQFTVLLKGALKGTKWNRKYGRKRSFRYTSGQKLLAALKEVDGVRSVQYPDSKSIKIGCDRNVSYTRIKALILEHGNKGDGSAFISDVRIDGARQVAKKPPARKNAVGTKKEEGPAQKKESEEDDTSDDLK